MINSDAQLIWESYVTEMRRSPDDTNRLKQVMIRYRELMMAQGPDGDYFDWDQFDDYSDYEDEVEALEKEAEAGGYLDDMKRSADDDLMYDRNDTTQSTDSLQHAAWRAESNRFTKAGKLNKQDAQTLKKNIKSDRQSRKSPSNRRQLP